MNDLDLSPTRKWAITLTVMVVTVLQVLDTSITNVALPHMQGAMSASVEEISWVVTSYLAANAIVIPATGWLSAALGRRRFFLICTVVFTASSVLSGLAPNLTFLIAMRVLQGLGGGPVIPMAQAILWEMFPLRQRGMAMAVWGLGIMMAPIFGPTVGGWITDNWSWRWIFYINLPFGLLGFFLASAFLFDSPYVRSPSRVDLPGIAFMVVGFGCLQLFLDQGERQEWFDSAYIVTLALIAVVGIVAFLVRELSAGEPMMDLSVFADRNFAAGSLVMAVAGFGFYASMLLLALYSQKVLSYDAWTSGLVLAPGGVGNLVTLFIAGRLVTRIDQRILLGTGIVLNATAFFLMSGLTPEADYWALAWPRFVQGLGMGFVFVPLQTLALATVPLPKLGHATAAFSIVRNIGGSIGIALATSMLAQRSQMHQSTLVTHVTPWSASTADHLARWADHFVAQGADTFTAQRRALAVLYRETVTQAQVLAYADEFRILAWFFGGLLLLLPLLQRVRTEPVRRRATESRHAAPVAE